MFAEFLAGQTTRAIADRPTTSAPVRAAGRWPVKNPVTPIAETEQANLDAAVGLLLQRIRGPLGDKSHGGRFLSVAEVPEEQPVLVEWADPEQTIQAAKELRATVTYHADEIEFNG